MTTPFTTPILRDVCRVVKIYANTLKRFSCDATSYDDF